MQLLPILINGMVCHKNIYTTLYPFNGLLSRTIWVSWFQKGETSLDLNETRDDGVLGCTSAGPYANNLHLAPDR